MRSRTRSTQTSCTQTGPRCTLTKKTTQRSASSRAMPHLKFQPPSSKSCSKTIEVGVTKLKLLQIPSQSGRHWLMIQAGSTLTSTLALMNSLLRSRPNRKRTTEQETSKVRCSPGISLCPRFPPLWLTIPTHSIMKWVRHPSTENSKANRKSKEVWAPVIPFQPIRTSRKLLKILACWVSQLDGVKIISNMVRKQEIARTGKSKGEPVSKPA